MNRIGAGLQDEQDGSIGVARATHRRQSMAKPTQGRAELRPSGATGRTAYIGYMEHGELTGKIIGCAMAVHGALGPGFMESVYQNALAHELRSAGLAVDRECRLTVHYNGIVVGEFVADMVVNGAVLVELKAVQSLHSIHEVQVVNYLTATGLDLGLLFNFGSDQLKFKRKNRIYRPKTA